MTKYVLGTGPDAGVQTLKEEPIMEDDTPAGDGIGEMLSRIRISPEKREAFLLSRAALLDKGDSEVIALVLHLDNFAAVVDGLTIGLAPRAETARDIDMARREVQSLIEAVRDTGTAVHTLSAKVTVLDDAVAMFHGVSRSKLWWIIGAAFLCGAVVGWGTFFIKF